MKALPNEGGTNMRSLIRWEPFAELTSLREAMDRLFEESFVRPSSLLGLRGGEMVAPIDVYQTGQRASISF